MIPLIVSTALISAAVGYLSGRRRRPLEYPIWAESDDSDVGDEPEWPARDQAIYDRGWAHGYTWAALHPQPILSALRIDTPEET